MILLLLYSKHVIKLSGYNLECSSIDAEILAITYAIDNFRILVIPKKEILIRTDCEAILKFYKLKNEKKIFSKEMVMVKFHRKDN